MIFQIKEALRQFLAYVMFIPIMYSIMQGCTSTDKISVSMPIFTMPIYRCSFSRKSISTYSNESKHFIPKASAKQTFT